MKKIPNFLQAIALCLLLAVPSALAGEAVIIEDDLGRNITISSPSERVVFTMENALKTYYAVGDPKNVVALKDDRWMRKLAEDIFPVVDPNFQDKILINITGDQLNLESLARVDPDLIVLWASSPQDPNILAINDTLKVPVFAIYVTSLDDIYRQVDTMGIISGDTDRASEVKAIMERYVELTTNITDSIEEKERPKVYWMWTDVYGTAGVNSGINDLIDIAGGSNIMKEAEEEAGNMEHPVINQESLIKLNPDVIYMWYNENLDPEDIINGEDFKGWRDINAVKNHRVYEISNPYLFDAFSPRMPLALLHVACDLHPEKFQHVDLNRTVDQYNVDIWGVHYPSMAKAQDG
ncbi:MAG TPA: ABC transporter substrate-binding protein [Methanothrix sp.]|jgi:iron complex transport system substrate-binding protein|uniref:ABC transporter substrate-binding protein n=1 Tax=Methanothrix sp. TaxID=90426 RepID=UPI002B6138C7|nr:ABC transporter substrate-binding protein [Methanothrix sp.]MDI9416582.1 ABC transporter substrate-binding protein [Euryarchaeota archaeon]HON35042.1 ABC transporter substrate-binding protein [Methanothrix sp.]HRU74891.1 ABC transporter substrate-binding protein [Methanothrix sp.]